MDLGLVEYVVDKHDVPEPGLRTGDRGAFVEIHLPDGIEVEFVTADGHAQALLTLYASDVRKDGQQQRHDWLGGLTRRAGQRLRVRNCRTRPGRCARSLTRRQAQRHAGEECAGQLQRAPVR
jgi:hypothetical protein